MAEQTVVEKAQKIESSLRRMGLLIPCLAGLDLDLIIDEGRRMETLAPMIDPTAYMKFKKTTDTNMKIAFALREARDDIKRAVGPETWELMIRSMG